MDRLTGIQMYETLEIDVIEMYETLKYLFIKRSYFIHKLKKEKTFGASRYRCRDNAFEVGDF
jgi:hypothetical protein